MSDLLGAHIFEALRPCYRSRYHLGIVSGESYDVREVITESLSGTAAAPRTDYDIDHLMFLPSPFTTNIHGHSDLNSWFLFLVEEIDRLQEKWRLLLYINDHAIALWGPPRWDSAILPSILQSERAQSTSEYVSDHQQHHLH